MLTLRARLRDGKITFVDPLPPAIEGEQEVLITFLTAEEHFAMLPRDEHRDCKRFQLEMSEHEFEILNQLHQGYNNREIARRVSLKEGTVRNYLSDIYRKLGVRNRAEAVRVAIQLGLVDIDADGDSTNGR